MNDHKGIEGVYIVHAKQGYELHEQRINELFRKNNLHSFEFVTDGDPSNFTKPLLDKYFCPQIESVLSRGVLSCTLNHICCYEKIVAGNNRYALIFENDPFFLNNFTRQIEQVIREADHLEPGFIISLENTLLEFPHYSTIRKNKHVYPADHGRCAGAYLVDLKGAQNILEDVQINKCCEVIDWWHNTLIKRGVVRMYWAYPALTEQGSHNGLMSSTISSKNKSFIRRIRWNAQKIYKTHVLRWFKKK